VILHKKTKSVTYELKLTQTLTLTGQTYEASLVLTGLLVKFIEVSRFIWLLAIQDISAISFAYATQISSFMH